MAKKKETAAAANAKAAKTKQIRVKTPVMTIDEVRCEVVSMFSELPDEIREKYKLLEKNLLLKLARLDREEGQIRGQAVAK